MEHTATHEEHSGGGVKEIVRVTVILSVLTIVELVLGFWMMGMPLDSGMRLGVKGTIVILMMAKAFYIVAYFMHLKHESIPLKYSIVLPFVLILYFIVMAIAEGNYLNLVG